jgi:hypothetical protein
VSRQTRLSLLAIIVGLVVLLTLYGGTR